MGRTKCKGSNTKRTIMSELAAVVSLAQQGNHEAYAQIVERFQNMAFATAYAMLGEPDLAQDAAQEAFLDAYNSLPNLRNPAAFPGWFRRIVVKHSDRQIRGRTPTLVPLETADFFAITPGPEVLLQDALERHDIQAAIELLPPNQRMVTFLFYIEGYSQREIAAFLEIPISAVKKRLYNARQTLKERMLHMVQQTLQATRPSQDEQFAQRVSFFTAVLDGDVKQTQTLLRKNPALFTETAEWKFAIPRHYWTGATAIHLAASRGDVEMTQALLAHSPKATALTTRGTAMTSLHGAVLMQRSPLVQLLLDHGADVNAQNAAGQTALHIAAFRGDIEMAQHLLQHKARFDLTDKGGYTPTDLATLYHHGDFVKLLREQGAPLPMVTAPTPPRPDRDSAILCTGIKIIDLLAPIERGGTSALFTPASGVGLMVVLQQIMRNVQTVYDGHVVIAGLASHDKNEDYWRFILRETDADQHISYQFGGANESVQQQLQLAKQVQEQVISLRAEGKEVLLVVGSTLAGTEEVLSALSSVTGLADGTATTLLVFGHHTVGVEPAPLDTIGTAIAFGGLRVPMRWYPAVNEVRSRSHLFETTLRSTSHATVAAQAHRLLCRYADLHNGYEQAGLDNFWYIDDDPQLAETISRARRLHCFLTQPFFGIEPWSGRLGRYVTLAETIAGCQAILNGEVDQLLEEALLYVGALDEAIANTQER